MLGRLLRIAFNRGGLTAAHGRLGEVLNKKIGVCVVELSGNSDVADDTYVLVGRIPDNSFLLDIFFWVVGPDGLLSTQSSVGPDYTLAMGRAEVSGANWVVATLNAMTISWGQLTQANGNFPGAMYDQVTDGRIYLKKSGTAFDAVGGGKGRFFITFLCNENTEVLPLT